MSASHQLVSELLRPQQLGDLTLPKRIIDRLQRMIETDSVMNMLFHGEPGLGKTTAARLIASQLGEGGFLEINGSTATGVDFVREQIAPYTRTYSMLSDRRKLIFIDEAEYISKQAQAALRKVIEDASDICRFLFSVNDVSKIIPALHSRLIGICFDIPPSDRADVKQRLLERYSLALSQMDVQFDKERLDSSSVSITPISDQSRTISISNSHDSFIRRKHERPWVT